MNQTKSFNIDFNYELSKNILLQLSAKVELHHSLPYYSVTDFYLKDHPDGHLLLADIKIIAVKEKDGISWVHTDSRKESLLSNAIGKAIEQTGNVEITSDE